jgi:hypothetical protein
MKNRILQNDKINKSYIEHLKEFINNKIYDSDEKKEKIREIFDSIKKESTILYYSEITNIIYNVDRDDYTEISILFSGEAKTYVKNSNNIKNKEKNNILKVVEHIKLAITQKECLFNQQQIRIDELNKDIVNASEENKKLKDSYNTLNKNYDELAMNYKSIMVSFVSILGIFASIIFAVFGGFKQLEGLGNNLHSISIYKMFMYIGSTGIVITSIVFISFYAVSKITKLKLKSCCTDENCNCSIYKKYPVLMITYHLLVAMISSGFIILLLTYYYDFGLTDNIWVGILLISIFLVPLVLPIIIFIYIRYKK